MVSRRGNPIPLPTSGFTLAALGDSITRSDHGFYGGGNSFIDYAVLLSGGKLISIGNYGVAGQKATDMVARTAAALVGRPTFLNVLAGTNDVNQGVNAAGVTNTSPAAAITAVAGQIVRSTTDALRTIYNAAQQAGTIPILNTVPPYGFSTGLSDPRKIANEALNNWIRRHAATYGYPLVDHYATLADPGSINGSSSSAAGNWKYPALTYTSDGTHPTALAAGMMGQALLDALSQYLPKNRFVQPMTTLVDSAQSMFTIKNPFFNNQSTNPGVYPNNANTLGAAISNSAGVTYTMIQEAGVLGFALNVALSSSASSSGGMATQNSLEIFNAGDICQVSGVFSTDGGTSTLVQVVNGGTTYKAVNIAAKTAINQGYYFMEFVVPETATIGVSMLTGNPVASTAANAKFWYPKVFNATKHLGITKPLTTD